MARTQVQHGLLAENTSFAIMLIKHLNRPVTHRVLHKCNKSFRQRWACHHMGKVFTSVFNKGSSFSRLSSLSSSTTLWNLFRCSAFWPPACCMANNCTALVCKLHTKADQLFLPITHKKTLYHLRQNSHDDGHYFLSFFFVNSSWNYLFLPLHPSYCKVFYCQCFYCMLPTKKGRHYNVWLGD